MSGRIVEHIDAPDTDILVGVPCYKDGPMVERCLRSLQEPKVQLLIVDNGSASDVKQAIAGKGVVIRNDVNRYVNPAWNQMMRFFLDRPNRYDLLVIANSDLVLDAGWSAKLRTHRKTNKQEQIIFGVDTARRKPSMGAFFAMTKRSVLACYPIPEDLLVLGGDDFIFEVNRRVGCSESTIKSLTMFHVGRGTRDKSPEIWDISKRDTDRWHQRVLPVLVPQRVNEFISREKQT